MKKHYWGTDKMEKEDNKGVFQIQYILSSDEKLSDGSENDIFLHQLAVQRQNMNNIKQKLSCNDIELMDVLQKKFTEPGTVVAWQKQSLLWDKWDGNDFVIYKDGKIKPEDILELRLFNENAELRLVRQGKGFKGRIIKDDGQGWRLYVDTVSRIWGKNEEKADEQGFVTLTDTGRRLKMEIPAPMVKSEYYGLKTRNYVGEVGDMGQLGYLDYRFVALEATE